MSSITGIIPVAQISYSVIDDCKVVFAEAASPTISTGTNVLLSFFNDERVPPSKFHCNVNEKGDVGPAKIDEEETETIEINRKILAKLMLRPDQAFNLATSILRALNFEAQRVASQEDRDILSVSPDEAGEKGVEKDDSESPGQ